MKPRNPASRGKGSKRNEGETILAQHIALEGLPVPEQQHYWAKHLRNERGHVRMFRFDFAWPSRKLAVEVDGGKFLLRRSRAQHGRLVPVGQHNHLDDLRRGNLAALAGWCILRYTPEQVMKGEAIREIKAVFMQEGGDDGYELQREGRETNGG